MISTKILEASGGFTKEQKQKKVTPWIIQEAAKKFGLIVELQMERDARSGFKLWDACSMIEQGWEHLKSLESVDSFVAWALEKLGVEK